MLEKNQICRFEDGTEILINSCRIPNLELLIVYSNLLDVFNDLQIIRSSDKSTITINEINGRLVYEFFGLEFISIQMIENNDGTINVHYYFKQ